MSVRSELEALFDNNGLLQIATAHDWAAGHPTSDLYRALEWNDAAAAREHRYSQIRRLIAVHIIDEDRHRQTISLSIDRTAGNGYRRTDDVMEISNLRSVALADALEAYQRLRGKYDWLRELAEVHEALERTQQRQTRRRRPRATDENRPSV